MNVRIVVKRRADAQRVLDSGKVTKKAQEDLRISSAKVGQLTTWLSDLRRFELTDEGARIFLGHYAPALVWGGGHRVYKPMRYQCRPAGKPAFFDSKFPRTYNARRDNLEGGFWKEVFGTSHGVMVANALYENVLRPERNVVLEFRPRPAQDMLVACRRPRWQRPGITAASIGWRRRASPSPSVPAALESGGHPLRSAVMRDAIVTLVMSFAVAGAHAADSCVAQAGAKNLAGAAKASFLKKCTGDAVAASKTSCNAQAAEKKLAGAAKNSFVKKCVADATPDVQTTCDSVADDKKLAGAARNSSVSKCVADSLR